MSDISVSWSVVSRSAWYERLRTGVIVLTAAAAVSSVIIQFIDSERSALLGGVVAAVVAAFCLRAGGAPRRDAWSVNRDGRITVRWARGELPEEVTVAYRSSHVIVLRQGWRTLPIWRDATPAPSFRRLSIAVRWGSPQPAIDAPVFRANAADRT